MFGRHVPGDVRSAAVYIRPKSEVRAQPETEMWEPTEHKWS